MTRLAIFGLIFLAGCSGSVHYAGMESAEARFNRSQSERLCAFMSEETMFPDSKVREFAKAVRKGKIRKIDQLVAEGADVSLVGTRNCSLLFWAMHNEVGFRRLLELGANPNIIFDDSGSVMHWAARHKDIRYLELALTYGGDPNLKAGQFKETPIFETIGVGKSGNKEAMRLLLDSGADINAETSGEALAMSFGGRSTILIK